MTAAHPHRLRGLIYAVVSNLCFSTGGLWVRTIRELPDGYEMVLWRSIAMSVVLGAVVSALYRGEAVAKVAAIGRWGVVSAGCLAATFFAFILSVTNTTVANTTITMSLAPLMTAIAGLIFLHERVSTRTWLAIAVAAIGLATMFVDALGGDGWIGILYALGVPAGLAANVVINRRHGVSVDMVPTVLVAGLLSIAVALPLGWPLTASGHDIVILSLMGTVQLACGCLFITLAMRYLPAVEVGLFTLLETVLGPVWVWLAYGERPSSLALAGGMLIVGALILNTLLGPRPNAHPSPTPKQ
ncbi:MAG: DMT family transporter [Alphaproteobacteria bacterium]|nr:DMT family transporter [Alphaproteobacteria bacterium]